KEDISEIKHPPNMITTKQQEQLDNFLKEHKTLFSQGLHDLGHTNVDKYQIITEHVPPIHQKAYQMSSAEHEFIQQELQSMLQHGLIAPQEAVLPIELQESNQKDNPDHLYDLQVQSHIDYITERLQQVQIEASENIKLGQKKQKERYNKQVKDTKFHIGDKVLLYRSAEAKVHGDKFREKWKGLYYIHNLTAPGVYKLRTTNSARLSGWNTWRVTASGVNSDCIEEPNEFWRYSEEIQNKYTELGKYPYTFWTVSPMKTTITASESHIEVNETNIEGIYLKHSKHKAIYKEEQVLNQLEYYKDASVLLTEFVKKLVKQLANVKQLLGLLAH
ncbi:7842_t:CDS:2, partial [Dentiscutata erythropus]